MPDRMRFGVVAVLLVAAATLAAAGPPLWRWWSGPPAGYCAFCLRPEHTESRVKVQPEGEPVREACCLSCALSYQRQTGKHVRILAVTEHGTGRLIGPAGAVFVVGSDVSPCQHDGLHVGEGRGIYEVRWDRCLPSILAFASREEAAAFEAQHGGTIRTLEELQRAASSSREGSDG
jgi:hypothetical protein